MLLNGWFTRGFVSFVTFVTRGTQGFVDATVMFLPVEEDVCDLGDVDAVSALLQKSVVFTSAHNGKFNNCALFA